MPRTTPHGRGRRRGSAVGSVTGWTLTTSSICGSHPKRRTELPLGVTIGERLEYAESLWTSGIEKMFVVATGALALSITFRESLVGSSPKYLWLLGGSWIALTTSILGTIGSFIARSRVVASF